MTTFDGQEPGTSTLVNEGGRPSYTYSADWGWMSGVSDQGWRYYSCVRSFIFDKPAKWTLEITDETVAELLGRSVRSVARARQDCYAAGLVEEVEFAKRSVAVPGQVKREVRTFRTLRVAHEPAAAYGGPVNCFTEKDRIEEQHGERLEQARTERQRKRRESTKMSSRADQRKHERKSKTAGQPDSTDLSLLRTEMSHPRTNLSENTPPDQPKQDPKQVVKQVTTTNQPAPAAAPPVEAVPASPGWLAGDEDPKPEPPTTPAPEPPTPGVRFLEGLPARNRPDRHAIQRLAPKVGALLAAEWSAADLRQHLTVNTAGCPSPVGVLITRLDRLPMPTERRPHAARPEWCGQCDELARLRELDDGRFAPCPTCSPRARSRASVA